MENTFELASMRLRRALSRNINNRSTFDNKFCTCRNNCSRDVAAHLAWNIPVSHPLVVQAMRPDDKNSLCFSCDHGNYIVSGKDSSFLQCRKHFTDPRYPKYPLLPVFTCGGYKASS